MKYLLLAFLIMNLAACFSEVVDKTDSFVWLEDSESKKTKDWLSLKKKNIEDKIFKNVNFKEKFKKNVRLLELQNKIPNIQILGKHIYSLYKPNPESVGQWRRTKLGMSFGKLSTWEIVLDLDRYSKNKGKQYSFSSVVCLLPRAAHCLISLSKEGSDLVDIIEFDVESKKIVKGGFSFLNTRAFISYIDQDHVAVTREFEAGTVTEFGFGRQLKVLKRGVKPSLINPILEIPKNFVAILMSSLQNSNETMTIATEFRSQSDNSSWLIQKDKKYKLPIPKGSTVWGVSKGSLVFSIIKEWRVKEKNFSPGDLLSIPLNTITSGKNLKESEILTYHENSKEGYLKENVVVTKDYIAISLIKNVRETVKVIKVSEKGFSIVTNKLFEKGNLKLIDSGYNTNKIYLRREGFAESPKLLEYNLETLKKIILYEGKTTFDKNSVLVEQRWAKSKDGTNIPYYLIGKPEVLKKGSAPLILKGYGSYGTSLLPKFMPIIIETWVERGGIYAIANVRGGGEFGAEWYLQAVKKTKVKSIEDFNAVSKNIIDNKISTRSKFGIYGGSMGGLLVAAAMNENPNLFKAVAVAVPVLDLIRGKKLVKANWVGETGDPDVPGELEYVRKISPLHNIKNKTSYPAFFAYTPSSDNRVHPANARKMVAKLDAETDSKTYYLETKQGGHAGSLTQNQSAYWRTMMYEFFSIELGLQ